jgi:hypothetical protein
LVIDTAWAAVVLNRSPITHIARVVRIIVAELKGCTRRYFFFFFAVFFAVFLAVFFFAFIALVSSESPESCSGNVNVKIFWRVCKQIFPLTPIGVFDRYF